MYCTYGGSKVSPQSMNFKNDAKELKLYTNSRKDQEWSKILRKISAFVDKKSQTF